MASRKVTITLPGPLAEWFLHRIPARDRSRYVAEAIEARRRERNEKLIQSCLAANRLADGLEMEQDFDALADSADRIEEPWDAPSR
jgi:hypothetical protein